jgi:hypothetical protein
VVTSALAYLVRATVPLVMKAWNVKKCHVPRIALPRAIATAKLANARVFQDTVAMTVAKLQ